MPISAKTRTLPKWSLPAAGLFGALILAGAAKESPLDAQLKAIKAVQKLGEGNVAASKAWQPLSQADANQLIAILAAMDDANPIAQNWLHAAVDSIAERTLKQEKKLPTVELARFVENKKHSPRGRRLAFDWLTRVDPGTPDRFIPGMLNDPGLEFRRDAIDRVIAEAKAKEVDQPEQATAIYKKAFDHARDLDQIKQLAEKLAALKQPVDLPASLGFVLDWKLIGPFDNKALVGFDTVYPPETKIDRAASYDGKSGPVKWSDTSSSDDYGLVDLNKSLGKANGVAAYAVAEFVSPKEQDVDLRLGSGNASKVWLNGELLSESRSYHANDSVDQFVGKGRLKKGKNVILLKILQNEQKESWAQKWEFQLRVCDNLGTAVLSTDRKPRQPAKPPAEAAASLN